MASILEHLEHEMNNYRESMENMTRTFMNQFLGLVRDYVECTMLISHQADLIGPTIPEGCLSGDCESPYPFILEFQVDTHLSHFQGKENLSSPSFARASPTETSISMPRECLDSSSLGEPEECEQYENDASVHDHDYDEVIILMLIRSSVTLRRAS